MAAEKPLKSSFELAMDRLKAKDKADGVKAVAPLTKAQKERIATIRAEYAAKIAELEILHRKNVAGVAEPAERAKIEEHYKVDRERAESRRDSEIERARSAKT